MPNWADNILKINGAPERIEALREFIAGVDDDGKPLVFDFEKVIPTPAELMAVTAPNRDNAAELIAKYGHADWYEFRNAKWGTKWRLKAGDVEIGDTGVADELEMRFNSAWNGPDGVVEALGPMFPDLEFNLWSCDPSMDWGQHTFVSGDQSETETSDFDESYKEMFGHEDWDEDEE